MSRTYNEKLQNETLALILLTLNRATISFPLVILPSAYPFTSLTLFWLSTSSLWPSHSTTPTLGGPISFLEFSFSVRGAPLRQIFQEWSPSIPLQFLFTLLDFLRRHNKAPSGFPLVTSSWTLREGDLADKPSLCFSVSLPKQQS